MAVQVDATEPRILDNGQTARQALEAFVTVQTAGARDVARRLEQMAMRALEDPTKYLQRAAVEASRPILEAYKASIRDVTGNLKKSVKTRPGKKKYAGVGIAVTGPMSTGTGSASERDGSGNHAWLLEFGTGPRKPGSQNRRAYINVHQMINGRFRRVGNSGRPFNNKQFERMGKGYYFLMGSINEPTRQARKGSGYPHDFGSFTPGESFPVYLEPGETLAPVKPQNLMKNAIQQSSPAVLSTLIAAMNKYIDQL